MEHPVTEAFEYVASTPAPTRPAVSSPVVLGNTAHAEGTDFALLAPHASAVTLCLFDDGGNETRYALNSGTHGMWSGHVGGVRPGQRYGYRVEGRWAPESGLLYNPAKLLLDPYAKAITGAPQLAKALFSPGFEADLVTKKAPDPLDSAPFMSLGVVTEPLDIVNHRPNNPWSTTVIYETHVKGLTMLHPDVPEELRGTYAGVGHPAIVSYLKSLGITAIELLPIHAKMDETFLTCRGLTNYWGYNTLNYFTPEPSYATKTAREAGPHGVINEVRDMVSALHAEGIEVILDVVYNHTCEGPQDGPMVSWRGIDSTSYYMAQENRPGRMMDTTGCGNSLDFRRRSVLYLALDSLRYWVENIGVDGFRFDLAVTLGRNGDRFDTHHPFLMALTTDPVLRNAKLINEPWDLGPNGWRTGQFPTPMADWNDHFRNTVRYFWVSAPRTLAHGGTTSDMRDLATRLAGSADLFGHGRMPGGRGSFASINFITAHDGFTMRDLVSYNDKHNEANKEANNDGTNHNNSWNFGFEGSEGAPDVVERERRTAVRNMLATLIFSAGTPMLLAGDEFGRSQGGNNNSYCQDNEISWLDWDHAEWQSDLTDTVRYLLQLRREIGTLRPSRFYTKTKIGSDDMVDLQWFDTNGEPMPQYRWFDPHHRVLQMLRSGAGRDRDVLIVFNGSPHAVDVRLPLGRNIDYELAWDSNWEKPDHHRAHYAPLSMTRVEKLSVRIYLA